MSIDFPNSPSIGQVFVGPKGSFTWDGVKWAPSSMSDAPSDGNIYGRQNDAWAVVTTGAAPAPAVTVPLMDGTAAVGTSAAYARGDHVHPSDTTRLTDAPSDANTYGRHAGAWMAIPAPPTGPGTLVSIVVYNTSQTITIPSATQALVVMWGATGGSGGVTGGSASAGSSAGGYLEKYLTGLLAGNTLVYTQGAAGTAGTSAPSAGGNAGTTLLASGTQTIATLTCTGSLGTAAESSGAVGIPTAGGVATGGDINLTGQLGNVSAARGLSGGATFYSLGAAGVPGSSAGNPGNPGGLKITWYA
jgi:hypothetical protein